MCLLFLRLLHPFLLFDLAGGARLGFPTTDADALATRFRRALGR